MQGKNLRHVLPHINSFAMELQNLIQHCLDILINLNEKGITQRNICRNNILVENDKPVLLDFGWAVSKKELYFTPSGLGGYERSPNGDFSDIYSMGKILEYVNRQHYRAFDRVISLMTRKDASMRISDLDVLKTLFDTALKNTMEE